MGIIRIENIRTYSYHGCLEEEAKIGSEYRVDIEVKANLKKSSKSDKLIDTVDYVHLNLIVKEEMDIRSELLEHVAKRIQDRVLEEIPRVSKVIIAVSKVNPPIGGDVEQVTVVLKKSRK
ncbi:dihydroneopterin aldolase [Flavicella sp.]|uniref:dihydroneopterin aldolase n=1 Tax=Flavicella sp. TaxID=2957742 RepID=UPI00301730C7